MCGKFTQCPLPGSVENFHLSVSISHFLGMNDRYIAGVLQISTIYL